jgi:hypothetical protein
VKENKQETQESSANKEGLTRGKYKEREKLAPAGSKRKYDLVFNDDDIIQSRKSNVPSQAPWIQDIDFLICRNVAEV